MKFALPAFQEVEPDSFKSVAECNLAEFLSARERERDVKRRRELDRLFRLNGATWKSFPLMTVGDMIVQ